MIVLHKAPPRFAHALAGCGVQPGQLAQAFGHGHEVGRRHGQAAAGLGHRVVREVEELLTDESAKRAMAETSARAEEIRQSRTQNAGGPK